MLKNKTKGFTLLEIIVVLAILAILITLLVPSYLNSMQATRAKKDIMKIESMCTAFKTALSEPEVMKEAEEVGGGGELTAVFYIDENGLVVFNEGKLLGANYATLTDALIMEETDLWKNSYQTIDLRYQMESEDHYNHYIIFTLTPKTYKTTAKCEYEMATYFNP